MKARRRSSASSSRVRFSGSESGRAHQAWFRAIAEHYDHLYDRRRITRAYPFLHDLFRRRGPVHDVLDVACGTFVLDLPLLRRGYRVVGRDLSEGMLRVARRNLAAARRTADLGRADMRTLRLPQTFDAVLCLGTAFNYLAEPSDIRAAFRTFREHLRPGGLLVFDITNFDPWIRNPRNACTEADYRAPDGTRVAIFSFNDQDLRRKIHVSRAITVIQRGHRINIAFDEAPLRVWGKADLAAQLGRSGFRPIEWWGDLRLGERYVRTKSPRLVSVSARS